MLQLKQSTHDDINTEIYGAMDKFMCEISEDEFDSEEEWFATCAEQAISEVMESLKADILIRWGINY